MPGPKLRILDSLESVAKTYAAHSHVLYSGRPRAAVLLLSDGQWIPGVRVESASFSLTIPALLNAFSTAVALERTDVLAIVQSEPIRNTDEIYLESLYGPRTLRVAENAFLVEDISQLPDARGPLDPFIPGSAPGSPVEGVEVVRQIAQRAHVPESSFPVGTVLIDHDGRMIPGVNVEHEDWSRILCAERNALGTAISYGIRDLRRLYLTCSRDHTCTPCGACRQLLAELAPQMTLFLDRGLEPPEETTPKELLPGFFSGNMIAHERNFN